MGFGYAALCSSVVKSNMPARFKFGKNWQRFLAHLNEERIQEAEKSLQTMLGRDRLEGLTFLDIGSGSGLFSLAARRLGAKVRSFDYDNDSVACTEQLKQHYGNPSVGGATSVSPEPDNDMWVISWGDVLDEAFIASLGQYDLVYAWGVLHHTGDMWRALEHAGRCVKSGGQLFIAIYNDQGKYSRRWLTVKKIYCSGFPGRWLMTTLGSLYFMLVCLKEDLGQRKNPLTRYREYKKNRGMSIFTDWIDWFGGYPFEVATPEALRAFYRERGFAIEKIVTVGDNLACNEFVFKRTEGLIGYP